MKSLRNFSDRSLNEQQFLIEDTWCDYCNAADIGMRDANEYEEDGEIIVEGFCRKCGSIVRSHIREIIRKEPNNKYEV